MRQQKYRVRGFSRAGRVGVVAFALGAALGMTGCATGQLAQTAQQLPAVNGGMGQTGKVAIRNASLAYPVETDGVYAKGSDVELALTIVSQNTADDKLVKVSAKVASDVVYEGSRTVPGGGSLVVGAPARVGEGGAQPTESTTSAPDLDGAAHARIVLQDTTVPVRSGQDINVTFTFKQAGSVTVNMPMANPPYDAGARESGGGSGSEQGGH